MFSTLILFLFIGNICSKSFVCSLLLENNNFEKLFSNVIFKIDLNDSYLTVPKKGIIKGITIREEQFSDFSHYLALKNTKYTLQRILSSNSQSSVPPEGLRIIEYSKVVILNLFTKLKTDENKYKLEWRSMFKGKGIHTDNSLSFKLALPIRRRNLLDYDNDYYTPKTDLKSMLETSMYVEFSFERNKKGRLVLNTKGIYNYMHGNDIQCIEQFMEFSQYNEKSKIVVDKEPFMITIMPQNVENILKSKSLKKMKTIKQQGFALKIENNGLCALICEEFWEIQKLENCEATGGVIKTHEAYQNLISSSIGVYVK